MDNFVNGYTSSSVRIFPNDLNPEGTLFGGVILSHIDKIASVISRRFTKGKPTALLSMYAEIKKPVKKSEVLILEGQVVAKSLTSFMIHIQIRAQTLSKKQSIRIIGDAILTESRIENNKKYRLESELEFIEDPAMTKEAADSIKEKIKGISNLIKESHQKKVDR